ncbi:MAG: hypothetical protein EBU90_01960 [Proteobacteria bacterium]|nr:hypothetical protein [Pseudomonadota bacterium]NBP13246.1 hypothetical protein [bacterium]
MELTHQQLLHTINQNLQECITIVKYQVVDLGNRSVLEDTLNFLNQHYNFQHFHNKLEYTWNLLKYYIGLGETIGVFFYLHNERIGFIMGRMQRLVVRREYCNSLEVNFLCLLERFRKLGINRYMKMVLQQQSLLKFNRLSMSTFTISHAIHKYNHYTKKQFYYKPLNVHRVEECGILGRAIDNPTLPQNVSQVAYVSNQPYVTQGTIDVIYNKLLKYYQNHYEIYEIVSKTSIHSVLTNPAMHVFIRFDDHNNPLDFACYYTLIIRNSSGVFCRSAYLYMFFFDDATMYNDDMRSHELNFFDTCDLYMKQYQLCELVTYPDPFGLHSSVYAQHGMVDGKCGLFYYCYNKNIQKTHQSKVSLVTI